jgi:hypothetical protein
MADPKINSEDGLVSSDHGSEEGSANRRVGVCISAATNRIDDGIFLWGRRLRPLKGSAGGSWRRCAWDTHFLERTDVKSALS